MVIYLYTILYLVDPDIHKHKDGIPNKYSHSVVMNAYKNKKDCLERLDRTELTYRRQAPIYDVESYTRINENLTGKVKGFSVKDKNAKEMTFYECIGVSLLD